MTVFWQPELLIKTQKAKENFAGNHGHNILDFLLFYQIFLSLQVKPTVIISNKHGIYELSHELPNDLSLKILGN